MNAKVKRNGIHYARKKHRRRFFRDAPSDSVPNLAEQFQSGELLVQGENLHVLQIMGMQAEIRGKVRLVYIDPPFGTRQDFRITADRISTISRGNGGVTAYSDKLSGESYLRFIRTRLAAIRDVMADDGSMYVHIDCKIGHYMKCLMDEVFGPRNFINDITRIKCNPKNFSRKGYGNIKDMVLFYRKGKDFVWNDRRGSIRIAADDERFRRVGADGRRYTTTPLHAPGETRNGATGKPWRGLKPPPGRHWRYAPEVLEELDLTGLIEWSSTGNPRKKIYADQVMKAGVKIQDVWMFKDPQHPKYPTEKNLEMLKLIVENSSDTGDIVLDVFCGSGTTLVAARELGRRWIGSDNSPIAITTSAKRLPGCRVVQMYGHREGLESPAWMYGQRKQLDWLSPATI